MATSILKPTADLLTPWNVQPSGAPHWDAVRTEDGDISYIWARFDTIYGTEMLTATPDPTAGPPLPEVGFISSVVCFATHRVTVDPGGSGNVWHFAIRINGVDYVNAFNQSTFSTSWTAALRLWTPCPATGLAWTVADVRGIEGMGVSKDQSSMDLGNLRITRLQFNVVWTDDTRRNLYPDRVAIPGAVGDMQVIEEP